MTGKIHLTPEETYRLVVAALEVVGSASPGVHRRIERAYAEGGGSSNPTVRWDRLVELRRVLNEIPPGGLADKVIQKSHEQRQAARTRPNGD